MGNNQGIEIGEHHLSPRVCDNDEQVRFQDLYPGRYLGIAGIDVSSSAHDALEELERCKKMGLVGAAIEPGRAPFYAENPADCRLNAFYDLAQSLGMAIFIQTSGLYGGRHLDYAHPQHIDVIAERFPKLHIICGHGCYPFVREMITVAIRRRNVYPSPDLYIFTPSGKEWIYAVNKGHIDHQFLFGSGYPLCTSLPQFVMRFLLLGWRTKKLDLLLFSNAFQALMLNEVNGFENKSDSRCYGVWDRIAAAPRLIQHELCRRLLK